MSSGKLAEAAAAAAKVKDEINETDYSATVSADEMVDTNAYSNKKTKASLNSRNNEKSLMSTEKAAVAAMLAMKTSSDESDGDSESAGTTGSKSVSRSQREQSSTQQQQQNANSSRSMVTSV